MFREICENVPRVFLKSSESFFEKFREFFEDQFFLIFLHLATSKKRADIFFQKSNSIEKNSNPFFYTTHSLGEALRINSLYLLSKSLYTTFGIALFFSFKSYDLFGSTCHKSLVGELFLNPFEEALLML